MDLTLTSEQELLANATRRFLQDRSSTRQLRERHELGRGFDANLWREGAALGWTSPLVPDDLGGASVSGSPLRDLVIIAEEMGRVVAPYPLLPVSVVLDTLVRRASPEQRDEVVPVLLAGDSVATWALDEGVDGWNGAAVSLQATRADGGWILNGRKCFVQEAADSVWILVTARSAEGLTQFLVPAAAPGLSVQARHSLDLVRGFADLAFDQVRIPDGALVGTPGDADEDVRRQLQLALVLQLAETAGALDAVFEMTLRYAGERVAFGRPLASYQALKHRFADLKTGLEACHATATAAAVAAADNDANVDEVVSVAKSFVAERAPAIVQDCIQLHGGIGVTWEHDLHLYLRRVTQNSFLYGGARQHRERIAELIGSAA